MGAADGLRTVVFASGGGSNFQALIDRFGDGDEGVSLAGLVASREDAGAIGRARAAGIPAVVAAGAREEERLVDAMRTFDPGLVVLAGYMRLVPTAIVREWWGRIINVHPALLPSFGGKGMYGGRVHAAVLAAGARVTGVTVHFVDEAYDRGPIILQWPVPVLDGDDAASLAARVLRVEHRLLPDVVAAIAAGRVTLGSDGRVRWRPGAFEGEAFEIAGIDGETIYPGSAREGKT
ncbi:MAG: phosphoribosylglycinamide formyltransferase [Gemmatimonadota bacterium]|nr:phosphoribosylglycinamide formyltransferase [Gemmatimonadota bacterium]